MKKASHQSRLWRHGWKFALGIFMAGMIWFIRITPANDRDWLPEYQRIAWAELHGDIVTVHDIRNFDYLSETDYTLAYYDKKFRLSELDSVDLVAVYWMGPTIAHTFLSFGFAGDNYLAISIEARKEKGEGYSTLLKEKPEFYNSLTTNCTTDIWVNVRNTPPHIPFSWKILLSGYVAEYLYEIGRLDDNLPFLELQKQAYINPRAQAADAAPDFSGKIRGYQLRYSPDNRF